MANWFKIAGIVLMILGILIILGSTVVVVISSEPPEPTVIGPPWYVSALGFAMFVVGAYLYYLGRRKEKEESLLPVARPPD